MIGQTINEYCIEAELATTSTGTVYQSKHILLQVPRAIKLIHPQLLSKDIIKKRVQLALESWAKLDHPNFAHIFEAVDDVKKNAFGFVMDYVTGNTLREILSSQGKLGISQSIDYFIQIAKAMSFAHNRRLLHRKLAPENIKICPDESIKILGLGALRYLQNPKITPANLCVGKVRYMAPEQFQGNYSIQSDQYALGVILYEMVTGQAPFQGKTLAELYKMHTLENPIPPQNLNSEITQDLQKIILKMLAKKPQERYPSLINTIDALNEATDRIDFSNDNSLSSLMSKGRRSLERRNLENAIFYFTRVLSLYGINSAEAQEALSKRNLAFSWQKEEEDIRKIRDLAMQTLGYFDEDKLDQAKKYLRNIFEIMRRHPESSRARGVKMDLLHEIPDLVQETIKELETQYNKAKFNLKSAEKLIEDGQYQEAIGMLEEALRYDSGNEHIQKLMKDIKRHQNIIQAAQYYRDAQVYLNQKNYIDAITLFEKVLELSPAHNEAKKYLKQTQDLAEKERKQQLELEKLYREGKTLYEKGSYEEALFNFEKILEIEPKHQEVKDLTLQIKERVEDDQRIQHISFFYNQGHEFYKVQKWKEAIACFNRVLEIMPSHRNALQYKKLAEENFQQEEIFQQFFNNGVSLFESSQYRSALEKFSYLAQIAPQNIEVRKYRKLCLEFISEYGG